MIRSQAARPAFEKMKEIVDQHMALQAQFPLIKAVSQDFGTAKPQIDQMAGKDVNEARPCNQSNPIQRL